MRGLFSQYYSIFNDEIQKFAMELNGIMVKTLSENFEVTNIPCALTKIHGGSMNASKLCNQIMPIINSVQHFGCHCFEDAKSTFLKNYQIHFPDKITLTPQSIFKCCSLSSVDFELKNIMTFENWPVTLVGDGCAVNKSACDSLATNYGLLSPTTSCSAHAVSGSIKKMASSKTICVGEVVLFASGICPILQHFQLSQESKSLLNDALEMMNMKEVKSDYMVSHLNGQLA